MSDGRNPYPNRDCYPFYRYRAHVDRAVAVVVDTVGDMCWPEVARRVELGLHHGQQQQELLLTDIRHAYAFDPLRPAYRGALAAAQGRPRDLGWLEFPAGIRETGWAGRGFAFDNEGPRHRVFLEPFRIADRLVTNGEYLGFIEDCGYTRADLWLSDGWRTVKERGWEAPLYWECIDGDWWQMTLAGMRRVDEREPLCHVSYYEADAYARWAGKRLPTESE